MQMQAERIAQAFHEVYERLAPEHGYETREASAKPWADVPDQNKGLMIAVVAELLANGVIETPGGPLHGVLLEAVDAELWDSAYPGPEEQRRELANDCVSAFVRALAKAARTS